MAQMGQINSSLGGKNDVGMARPLFTISAAFSASNSPVLTNE
jgi:hypothetical protein